VLWLDKYKPKRFIDLLSDERTNREVLSWIKKWDRYVFPDKKPAEGASFAQQDKPSGFKQSFGGGGRSGNFPSKFGGEHPGNGEGNEDDDPRPFQKIILICGPPGAGKTTLANIVARHAGYNPIEVNASDDRTAGVLKNKVHSLLLAL
jgi:chromosome transmission fidelity protein 18